MAVAEEQDFEIYAPEPNQVDHSQLAEHLEEWDTATQLETQGCVEDLKDVYSEEDPVSKEELVKAEVAQTYSRENNFTEKKDTGSSEEFRLTEEQIEELEKDLTWQNAKKLWKEDHPNETIKEYKKLYLLGVINKFPWEDYLDQAEENQKKKIIHNEEQRSADTKNHGRIKPDLTTVSYPQGYIQNAEQKVEDTLWKRIRSSDESH